MMIKQEENQEIFNISNSQLKKITPYLDYIRPRLTPRQRKFCYFYCINGFCGADAIRKAGYKTTNKEKEDLIFAILSSQNLNKQNIKEAIKLIIDKTVENKRWLEKTLFEMFVIQSTYDPSVFYNPDGTVKFNGWDEIPVKYRCCIESMETKYYGKDANRKTIVLKLIDRKWAQDRLAKYIEIMNDSSINIGLTKETLNELHDIFNNYRKEREDE